MSRHPLALAGALALCAAPLQGWTQSPPPSSANPAIQAHIAAATVAAGKDFAAPLGQCASATRPPLTGPSRPPAGPPPGAAGDAATVEPTQVFDNLYFVGLRSVSAWAVKTSAGIILIDALNNGKEAQDVIAAGLTKVGLDPAQIKYVIVTHAHGDHYGGARWLAERYHPRIILSAIDWDSLDRPPAFQAPNWDPPPKRDMVVKDGDKLVLGDTTIQLWVTPGHTLGTLSLLIPVRDHGQPHLAAMWGGTAFNFTPSADRYGVYAASAARFDGIARAQKADVLISNHSNFDGSMEKIAALKARAPGQPHPFVIGSQGIDRFLTVLGECARANQLNMAAAPAAPAGPPG